MDLRIQIKLLGISLGCHTIMDRLFLFVDEGKEEELSEYLCKATELVDEGAWFTNKRSYEEGVILSEAFREWSGDIRKWLKTVGDTRLTGQIREEMAKACINYLCFLSGKCLWAIHEERTFPPPAGIRELLKPATPTT